MDKSMDKRRGLGIIAVAVAAMLLVSAVVAVDADAARGAGRGGKGGKGGSTATLSVAPNPVPAGTTTITISGSGFSAGQQLMVGPRGVIPTVTVTTDGSGAFSIAYSPWDGGFNIEGLYYVDARSAGGTTLATTTFMVQ